MSLSRVNKFDRVTRRVAAGVENRLANSHVALRIEIPYGIIDENEAELDVDVEVELDAQGNEVVGVQAFDDEGRSIPMGIGEFKQIAEEDDPGLEELYQMAQDAMRDQEEAAR